MKELALFFESDPIRWQMTEFEILRRTNVVFETCIEIRRRAANIGYAKSPEVIDVAERVGARPAFNNFVVDNIRR